MQINVQFSDSTQQTIVACFAGAQDSKAYPNQGTIDSSDARWKTFYEALPSLAQQTLPAPA